MAPKAAPKAAAPKAKAEPKAKAAVKAKPKPKEENPEDKIPKVPQPDKEAFDAAINAKKEEIDGLQKKLTDLRGKINERSTGKEGFHAQRAELRRKLDEYTMKLDAIVKQKEDLKGQQQAAYAEGRSKRQELNKMKKQMSYTDPLQIDERIATIEFQLMIHSPNLKEEKAMLDEIKNLKRNKAKVSDYQKKEAEVEGFAVDKAPKEHIDVLNAQWGELKKGKAEVQAELSQLMEGWTKQMEGMPEIFKKKEDLDAKIKAAIAERNTIRDNYRAEESKFNAYLAELRKVRQDRAREQRAERDKEMEVIRREREAEKLEVNPYISELALLDQTLLWCQSMLPKEADAKEEHKDKPVDSFEGGAVLLRKEDREEEFYFAATKGKKDKKHKGKKKDEGSGANIKHNMETFHLFDQLKLDAPMTTGQIPDTIAKLNELKDSFGEKVKAWEEKRDHARKRIAAGLPAIEYEDDEKKEEAKEEEAPAEEAAGEDES